MRLFYFLVLVIVLVPVVIFALQNDDNISLRFFDRSLTQPVYLVIVAVYVLGMLSGSSLVGLIRRSFHRMTERRQSRA
jgi:uncharacterized integral membrane protein